MELIYINDQQLINDTAQFILERHLSWSGSLEKLPSQSSVCFSTGCLTEVYLDVNYPDHSKWFALSEDERNSVLDYTDKLGREALQIADKKWEAAMTLLGFEI